MSRASVSLLFTGILVACAPEPPLEPTYANVAALFEASCSFDSCHGGRGVGAATLNFAAARAAGVSYDLLLVGEPACMYDRMPLVDPGNPDNSWLMLKVAGPHMGSAVAFTPASDWDHGLTPRADGRLPSSVCPLTVMGALSFGTVMPQGSSAGLDARRADLIRRWILEGAPGPDGTVGPRDTGPRDAGRPRTDAGPRDAAPVDGEIADADDGSAASDAADGSAASDAAADLDGAIATDAPVDAPVGVDSGPGVDAP